MGVTKREWEKLKCVDKGENHEEMARRDFIIRYSKDKLKKIRRGKASSSDDERNHV